MENQDKTPEQAYRALIQEHIDILIQERDKDYSWIPDLPKMLNVENFAWQRAVGQVPRIALPFDRKLMERVKAKMLELGFVLDSENSEQEAGTNVTRYNREVNQCYTIGKGWEKYLIVVFDDGQKGSVCKRRKIGVKAVEQPIFEYACSEMSQ